MLKNVKSYIRSNGLFQKIWAPYKCRQLHREYDKRRDFYAKKAHVQGIVYDESDVIKSIRARIANRGYAVAKKKMGDIHTFAFIPTYGWHDHLLPDLRQLGPVTHFDYTKLGFSVEDLQSANKIGIMKRCEMLKHLLPAFKAAHSRTPVDWMLFYGAGFDTTPSSMRIIEKEFGVPCANMSFDDKQSWVGRWAGECRTGMVDITSSFDLFATSSSVTCEWHLLENGRPIYMPEGFNDACYHPMQVTPDIPVSFIGASYGFRASVVDYLKSHGINVVVYGPGWKTRSVWGEEQARIINRSMINLGMGGIGYSEILTNVKTRDFEIPGTGGGVYITSFNPDLARHFVVGKEILCYRGRDEMLELIRYCLSHTGEAREIANRGRARCLQEHRWLHRYQKMLSILGILDER